MYRRSLLLNKAQVNYQSKHVLPCMYVMAIEELYMFESRNVLLYFQVNSDMTPSCAKCFSFLKDVK